MKFYQLRNDSRCIMVEAVDYWQENDTMYCVHFQGGDYMEMRSAEFNEFIKDYYEVRLTREEYKARFCKKSVSPLQKGKINIELNHAVGALRMARAYLDDSDEELKLACKRIGIINRLIEEIEGIKFNL